MNQLRNLEATPTISESEIIKLSGGSRLFFDRKVEASSANDLIESQACLARSRQYVAALERVRVRTRDFSLRLFDNRATKELDLEARQNISAQMRNVMRTDYEYYQTPPTVSICGVVLDWNYDNPLMADVSLQLEDSPRLRSEVNVLLDSLFLSGIELISDKYRSEHLMRVAWMEFSSEPDPQQLQDIVESTLELTPEVVTFNSLV